MVSIHKDNGQIDWDLTDTIILEELSIGQCDTIMVVLPKDGAINTPSASLWAVDAGFFNFDLDLSNWLDSLDQDAEYSVVTIMRERPPSDCPSPDEVPLRIEEPCRQVLVEEDRP